MDNEPTCGDCGSDLFVEFRECCLKYLCDECAERAGCATRDAIQGESRNG